MADKIVRHKKTFEAKYAAPNGKMKTITSKAVVKTPKKAAKVIVISDHAKAAIDADACGNSTMCTLANAVIDNASAFGHPVTGTIVVAGTTAYVVSKEKDGMPSECYRYRYRSEIPKLNDTPGGLQVLAKMLDEGPQELVFTPRPRNGREPKKGGTGRTDGSRSKTSTAVGHRGGKQRYIVAGTGGHPELLKKYKDKLK